MANDPIAGFIEQANRELLAIQGRIQAGQRQLEALRSSHADIQARIKEAQDAEAKHLAAIAGHKADAQRIVETAQSTAQSMIDKAVADGHKTRAATLKDVTAQRDAHLELLGRIREEHVALDTAVKALRVEHQVLDEKMARLRSQAAEIANG